MIRGIGIEISDPRRFQGMEHSLLSRIFTEREISAAPVRSDEYFAARFAAKEAFAKAIGTGIRGFSLTEVEVSSDDDGRPFFIFHGRAEKLAAGLRFHLSMSHERNAAVAVVVAEHEE